MATGVCVCVYVCEGERESNWTLSEPFDIYFKCRYISSLQRWEKKFLTVPILALQTWRGQKRNLEIKSLWRNAKACNIDQPFAAIAALSVSLCTRLRETVRVSRACVYNMNWSKTLCPSIDKFLENNTRLWLAETSTCDIWGEGQVETRVCQRFTFRQEE